MKTVTVRLTPSEHEALLNAGKAMNAPVGTLIKVAAMKLAERNGSLPRESRDKTTNLPLRMWPRDVAALADYKASSDHATTPLAALAAMRVGLMQRGYLTMEPGEFPD
jgi:hypothetical protein